jgi:hypothetical protein
VLDMTQHSHGNDGDPLRVPGRADGVRRRCTPQPVILPPVALPLTPERRERAVAALSQLFVAWWHEHGPTADDGPIQADKNG